MNNGKPLTDKHNYLATLNFDSISKKTIMKKQHQHRIFLAHHYSFYWLIAIALNFFTLNADANNYQKIDKIIAVIGEEDIIFASELERQIKQTQARLATTGKKTSPKDLESQALEHLILQHLQLKLAKKNNIQVSQEEIDSALEKTQAGLAARNISLEDYLNSQNLSINAAKKELEKELLVQKIQQAAINQRMNITEKEVVNFLESKAGKDWLTPRYQIGHILLPYDNSNNAHKKSVLNNAKKLYKKIIASNNSFQEFAQKYSKGPNAAKGGDLGIKTKDQLPPLFYNKISTLKEGDISQPFTSNAGVHILKLHSRNGAEPVFVEQYKVRHILIKVTDLFIDSEAEKKINTLYQALQKNADFATLAQEYSDDIGSKLNGGDLGWAITNKYVPEFARTIVNTPINTYSKPFRSQFGWHILKVEGKRTEDIFDTVKVAQAAKLLRRQRFNDELQIWLKEIRSNTYVDILL